MKRLWDDWAWPILCVATSAAWILGLFANDRLFHAVDAWMSHGAFNLVYIVGFPILAMFLVLRRDSNANRQIMRRYVLAERWREEHGIHTQMDESQMERFEREDEWRRRSWWKKITD